MLRRSRMTQQTAETDGAQSVRSGDLEADRGALATEAGREDDPDSIDHAHGGRESADVAARVPTAITVARMIDRTTSA